MSEQRRRRRAGRRGGLIVLACLLAAAAGVLIWQRKNLALLKYVGADEETVLAQQQENERTDETIRQEYQIPEVALSEQEEQALEKGTMTVAEAAEKLLQGSAEAAAAGGTASAGSAPDTGGVTAPAGGAAGQTPAPDPAAEKAAQLKSLLTQLYILRASFASRVETAILACRTEFDALPDGERNTASKTRIITAKIGEIAQMEQTCDAQVEAIAAQIRACDPELAERVLAQYENEKATEKALIISKYS